MKINKISKFAIASALTVGSVLAFSSTARADDLATNIQTVEAAVTLLMGITSGMTTLVVAPMGISAAARVFRHVVIANV